MTPPSGNCASELIAVPVMTLLSDTVEPGRITNKDFYLVKPRQTIVLHGVNFETGKADLLPEFDSVLARAGEILRTNPGIMVELAGHTDPREIATVRYPSNRELSQARAEAVKQYLVSKWGIASERLTAHGYADANLGATLKKLVLIRKIMGDLWAAGRVSSAATCATLRRSSKWTSGRWVAYPVRDASGDADGHVGRVRAAGHAQ